MQLLPLELNNDGCNVQLALGRDYIRQVETETSTQAPRNEKAQAEEIRYVLAGKVHSS